ncbi:unnamed protein product [Rotaria magnacalcarata]|uniref:Coiled-coil domain-containing protein 39 n=5 Tax=Rotaria magnacalcarata TaxID=392030 RepID=A0A815K8B7_9BILA|nr:unnamed protein product [Rotaria magnacalcarata]
MNFQQTSECFRNMNFLNDKFTDTRIPSALSNEENKLLEESVEAKMKELSSLQLDIVENMDRIQMLDDHQKLVQDELATIQRLLAARRREETTEQTHIDLDTVEIQRTERLIIAMDNHLMQVRKRQTNFEIEINEMHTQIDKINDETLNEKDTLEIYIDSMKKNDDDTFCLMKYTQQDNIRIKELTAQLEQCSGKSIKLKRVTEEGRLEYYSLQVELDKIADTFRRSYAHRQQLIQRWETMLVQMQRKDYDIDKLAIKFVQTKVRARAKEQELSEQKLFYEREQKDNIITENLIDLTNRKLIKLKAKQKTSKEKQEQLQADVFSLKTVLVNTQNECQREHTSINEIKVNIRIKQQELEKLKKRHEQILDRKYYILNEKFSTDEKLVKFENLMESEQKYQTNLNHQYKKLSEIFFQSNNKLLFIRKHEKQYEIDIQAYQNQIHKMKNQINQLDQQLLKQQELIYHQDFIKQSIDRRLNRLLGEKTNEKNSEINLKIRELQNENNKKKYEYDQLQNQIKILNEELRIVKRDFDQLMIEKNDLSEKFLQFDLYTTLSDKLIKKLNDEKEDYLVEENLLHIELKRLKNILFASSEINLTLEQQKIELHKVIKERRIEVQTNSVLFRMRFNDERTKRDSISTELALRITKVAKLKQRYEVYTITLNTDTSSEDNALAQAQYVIKSAQIKEELLQQGDQLEALIIKAETELRALENTVQILKWNNTDVKNNFEKLNESSPEINEMKELEEHLRAVTEQVKIRRKLLKHFSEYRDSVSHTDVTMFEEEIERTKIDIKKKYQIEIKLQDELQEYVVKINRADQNIKRLQQTIQQQQDIIQYELDIDVRLQNETYKKIEQQLLSLCLTINDESLNDIVEKLSTQQSFKITIKPSLTPPKKQQDRLEKKSTSSLSNINIVNISIDNNSRSTTSQSTKSSKKNR